MRTTTGLASPLCRGKTGTKNLGIDVGTTSTCLDRMTSIPEVSFKPRPEKYR